MQGKVILICGKIGAGKTTYADRLINKLGAVNLSQDELLLTLFTASLYRENLELYEVYNFRANEYTKAKAAELAAAGVVVILDNGFWAESERGDYRRFYASKGVACELHYVKTPEEQRLRNIEKRNADVENGAVGYVLSERTYIHHFEEPSEEEADVIVEFVEI